MGIKLTEKYLLSITPAPTQPIVENFFKKFNENPTDSFGQGFLHISKYLNHEDELVRIIALESLFLGVFMQHIACDKDLKFILEDFLKLKEEQFKNVIEFNPAAMPRKPRSH